MEVIKIEKYRAFDGEVFETKEECEKYEQKLNSIKKNILMFDEDMKVIEDYPQCVFLYVKAKEAAEFLFQEYGCSYLTPWDDNCEPCAGSWFFFGNNWNNLDEFKANIIEPFERGIARN